MELEVTMDQAFLIEGNLGRNNNVQGTESNNARNNRGCRIKTSLNLGKKETDKDTERITSHIFLIFLKALFSDPL